MDSQGKEDKFEQKEMGSIQDEEKRIPIHGFLNHQFFQKINQTNRNQNIKQIALGERIAEQLKNKSHQLQEISKKGNDLSEQELSKSIDYSRPLDKFDEFEREKKVIHIDEKFTHPFSNQRYSITSLTTLKKIFQNAVIFYSDQDRKFIQEVQTINELSEFDEFLILEKTEQNNIFFAGKKGGRILIKIEKGKIMEFHVGKEQQLMKIFQGRNKSNSIIIDDVQNYFLIKEKFD